MTDNRHRYFVRPAGVPGCFVLWDRRCDAAVYGVQRSSKNAAEACAQRLNEIYRQFLKEGDTGRRPPGEARADVTP
jgi:hypothetical protein